MILMVEYELIDHTADIGIRVAGKDLPQLFVRAAESMFDVIAEKMNVTTAMKKKIIKISLQAGNREELLLRWLSELLSLADCKEVYFNAFEIESLTDTTLEAKASGFLRKYFIGKREIKAVTYHELKIEEQGGAYTAEVIFDV